MSDELETPAVAPEAPVETPAEAPVVEADPVV